MDNTDLMDETREEIRMQANEIDSGLIPRQERAWLGEKLWEAYVDAERTNSITPEQRGIIISYFQSDATYASETAKRLLDEAPLYSPDTQNRADQLSHIDGLLRRAGNDLLGITNCSPNPSAWMTYLAGISQEIQNLRTLWCSEAENPGRGRELLQIQSEIEYRTILGKTDDVARLEKAYAELMAMGEPSPQIKMELN